LEQVSRYVRETGTGLTTGSNQFWHSQEKQKPWEHPKWDGWGEIGPDGSIWINLSCLFFIVESSSQFSSLSSLNSTFASCPILIISYCRCFFLYTRNKEKTNGVDHFCIYGVDEFKSVDVSSPALA
jgi:hypothetical protein